MEAMTIRAEGASRWRRIRTALTPDQWRRVGGMVAVIVSLHAVGFFLLFAVVAPHHFSLGSAGAFTVGIGITAYTLGMRHAFDADHIAAIDNTTRKLMSRGPAAGERRLLLLARPLDDRLRARRCCSRSGSGASAAPWSDDGSSLHQATGLIGPTVSGTFLMLIGVLNLVVLVSIVRIFRRMRAGPLRRGRARASSSTTAALMNRFYGRATRAVQQAVADVPARPAVRARVRHRHRGRAAGHGGRRRRQAGCRSTRSSACRSCSPPACRCSTRSTARS